MFSNLEYHSAGKKVHARMTCGGSLVAVFKSIENDELGLLFAASSKLLSEMERVALVISRAESDPDIWSRLTEGTGIATANGYRAAISKAKGV